MKTLKIIYQIALVLINMALFSLSLGIFITSLTAVIDPQSMDNLFEPNTINLRYTLVAVSFSLAVYTFKFLFQSKLAFNKYAMNQFDEFMDKKFPKE